MVRKCDWRSAAGPAVRPAVLFAVIASLLLPLCAGAAEEGGRRFPQAATPSFWKGRVGEIEAAVAAVKKGRVRVIARSPGGRPVHLVEYGERTVRLGAANYNSAAGAGDP